MIPTPKQAEFLRFARDQAKPIAWLGSIRAGKTVGGLMALCDAMERADGQYAITSVGQQNIDVNIAPVMKKIMDYRGWDVRFYKTVPQRWETPYGIIPVYLAGHTGMEKFMQGVTLNGAFSDEVLLYPKNFLMQLIGRFSKDDPFWVMTANKSDPSHWIKTEWIDEGHVALFESGHEDNPHISKESMSWWDTLLEGKYRDRMLGNDWAGDRGLIGAPELATEMYKQGRDDREVYSVWFDDSRGHGVAKILTRRKGTPKFIVAWSMSFQTIDDLRGFFRNCRRSYIVANYRNDAPSGLFGAAEFMPDIARYATRFTRLLPLAAMNPGTSDLHKEMRSWPWVSASADGSNYRPDEASPEALACIQGVYHLSNQVRVFSTNGGI